MGLLDDAIREHLDLKRRRGADPTEVEREEREVLGPVRRRGEEAPADEHEPEFLPEDDLDHEPLPHASASWDDTHPDDLGRPEPPPPAAAFDHEQVAPLEPDLDPYAATDPDPAPHATAPPEPFAAPPPEPAPYAAPPPEPAPYAAPPPEPAPFAAPEREPEPHLSHDEHEPPAPGEATVEYDVEDAIKEERPHPEDKEEDVLEETPDFLQDTPDHDRLWFEQRPPRDFDFDG